MLGVVVVQIVCYGLYVNCVVERCFLLLFVRYVVIGVFGFVNDWFIFYWISLGEFVFIVVHAVGDLLGRVGYCWGSFLISVRTFWCWREVLCARSLC